MKKLFTFTFSLLLAAGASAQPGNAGMESWRTGFAGLLPPVPIASPTLWWGFDSLAISAGQTFGLAINNQQVFRESSFVHSGSSAAKIVSVMQDTIGIFPGVLANAAPSLDLGVIAGGGDPMDAIIFDGGSAVTVRPVTVSAWVAYLAGKDATTGAFGGPDAGVMTAQAIATIGGNDSTVGVGFATVSPSAAYTEITTTLTYSTTDYPVHTLRVIFTSGGGGTSGAPLDSSVMYVDDLSMTSVPNAVKDVYQAQVVSVYPNPASGAVYFMAPGGAGYTCSIADVAGREVKNFVLRGKTLADLGDQPAGVYIYTVYDAAGIAVQRGKLALQH